MPYQNVNPIPRILLLLLLIVVLSLGGLLWFDYLGLIDAKSTLAPILGLVGIQPPESTAQVDDPLLLDKERLKKERQALELLAESLDNREEELLTAEEDFAKRLEALEEREKQLEEKETSFDERVRLYDDKKKNIEQIASDLGGMPPDNAVAIMNQMEVQYLIDVLRTSQRLSEEAGEAAMVSFWLSLMAPERAAEIQRKMAIKPSE